MPNFEPLAIVCSKTTQRTSSLPHFDLRGPAVGYQLHDTLMPYKCFESTKLVNTSYLQGARPNPITQIRPAIRLRPAPTRTGPTD